MNNILKTRLNSSLKVLYAVKTDLIALKRNFISTIYCFAAQPKVQSLIYLLSVM